MKHIKNFSNYSLNEGATKMPKGLVDKIQKHISAMRQPQFYWDYNDRLQDSDVQKILEGKGPDMLGEIFDNNLDNITDIERAHLAEALKAHDKEIAEWLGEDVDDLDFKELANQYSEYFDISIDMDWDQLFKNTGDVNCRVELHTNYEGLTSDFDNTYRDATYTYDDAMAQIIDALNLNPKKVKDALGEDADDSFVDKPDRNGNEYVSYEAFEQELRNNSTISRLTFLCKVDLRTILGEEYSFPRKFYVPKGNECGLFSSFQGGGSLLEMELKKPFLVDLDAGDKYDHYYICVDSVKDYSIDSVYGLTSDAFGGKISKAE